MQVNSKKSISVFVAKTAQHIKDQGTKGQMTMEQGSDARD